MATAIPSHRADSLANDERVRYCTLKVDGLSIFYREAGPAGAPVLLLIHGFPSSSRMFEPLLVRLSDRYRLIAPDYVGFGHSEAPDPKHFTYTFDHLAEIVREFLDVLQIREYTVYMQDYGGPIGFRLVVANPSSVRALIIQNAVAHEEGLGALWKTRRAFWANRSANEAALRENLLSFETTRMRHLGHDPDPDHYNPDFWTDEFAFLRPPGQDEIQSDLFYDYQSNIASYKHWQSWMRQHQPKLLVLWGKYNPSFEQSEPRAYQADVPDAEIHILEAGHFALDTAADEIATLVRGFMK